MKFFKKIFNQHYEKYLIVIENSIKEFKQLGHSKYIRHSEAQKWREKHNQLIPQTILFRILKYFDRNSIRIKVIQKYEDLINNLESRRDESNKYYIQSMLCLHKEYFDNVEKNPLTEKQRIACIKDEDNNLVLAGAGSGKTSVIVAKAGFIEKSKRAASNEILILAFGNKASKETDERIKKRIDKESKISSSTFHSLGLKIIGEVRGKKPRLHPSCEYENKYNKLIDGFIKKFTKNSPSYSSDLLKFFSSYLLPIREPEDFNNIGEYYSHIKNIGLITFAGENVKSHQELQIANFFFINRINYIYEKKYEHDTATPEFSQYKPDFYLPDANIYIEHFGIDENGNPPDLFSSSEKEKYKLKIMWKRKIHSQFKTILEETHSADFDNDFIWDKLTKIIEKSGLVLNEMNVEELMSNLHEDHPESKFSQLIGNAINLQKNCSLSIAKLEQIVNSDFKSHPMLKALGFTKYASKRLKAFMRVYKPLYEAYQDELSKTQSVDFNDMINEASQYVRSGNFKSQWKYILIDEFQDISESRKNLIIALRDNLPTTSLFCVGDDWQAIYRFTGSDIRFTNEFKSIFGHTEFTKLDLTFRFNNSISGISSNFITKNPKQIKKIINTYNKVNIPAVSIEPYDDSERQSNSRLKYILSSIDESNTSSKKITVYILGRYNYQEPENLRKIQKEFNNLEIKFYSVHASKGKEADYVIIIDFKRAKNGRGGFPSEVPTDPLLEIFLPEMERYPHAEERRLFYVALTRSKHRTYILSHYQNLSIFAEELLSNDEYIIGGTQISYMAYKCFRCNSNMILKTKKINKSAFYGCSNFPICDSTQEICPKCMTGPLLLKKVDFFDRLECINCGNIEMACPRCAEKNMVGILTERNSKYGKFKGCKNFRGKQENSCTYKI